MGKTAFALNVAQHVALEVGGTVGVFSLEMSVQQLIRRMVTGVAQVDAHKLSTGFLSNSDKDKLLDALHQLSETKIFIDDTAAITVLEMRAKARRLAAEHGLDLLVIDYLQLVRGSIRTDNRNLEIGEISRGMKALAKELEVPVVCLSQLSRAPETRSGHRPQLSDLRESGNIEQDADVVAFIFRPEVYSDDPELEGIAELIISKQRNGPIGTVPLAFLKAYTLFKDRADVDEPY
jgi:replicative DNA helicase